LYEGISHLRNIAPEAAASNPAANYIVLALAACIEGWSFLVGLRQFNKFRGKQSAWGYIRSAKDPSTYTVVLEDSAALLGLTFAFLGVFLGHMFKNAYLDGASSVVIGLLLMCVTFLLAFQTKGLLLGEGADPRVTRGHPAARGGRPGRGPRGRDTYHVHGPYELLVNLGVEFKPCITTEKMHEAIHRIEGDVQSAHPECTRMYFEAESLP